jgi:small-conductance mechanosensitive channel
MAAVPRIDWGSIDEALTGGQAVSGEALLVAGLVLGFGLLVAVLIGRWRRRQMRTLQDQAREFLGLGARIAQMLVVAISVGWALNVIGADIGWLNVVLIVAGVILVLAARPVIEGIGASAALVTRSGFNVGDEIAVDDAIGKVVEITNRSTVIRLRDARRVHIPNVEMLSKTVMVYTVDRLRRSAVEVTVGFESDVDQVEQLLRDALSTLGSIERVGSIRAQEVTSGVQLSVRFWHPSGIQDGNDAVDDAVRTIVTTLRREHIAFAPPVDLAIVEVPRPTSPREPGDGTAR